MAIRLKGACLGLVTVWLAAACGSGVRPRDDAGGPRLDASLDAAADGSGGDLDGGRDAEAVVDPGWAPMPGLPDGCPIERAEHPEGVFSLNWLPCPEPIEGCEVLEDAPPGTSRRFATAGSHDGEVGYFAIISADEEGRGIKVLADTSPSAYAAWREPPFFGTSLCFANPFGVGASHDAFGIYTRGDNWPTEHRIYWAPHEEIGTATDPLATLADIAPADYLLASSLGVMASTLSTRVTFMSSAQPRELDTGADGSLAAQQSPFTLVGDDVFWHSFGDTVRVAHAPPDGETELFLANPDGDIRGMRTDGTDWAWYVGNGPHIDDGGYDRLELWTAPYTADPEELEPRLVRVIDPAHGYQQAAIGGGHWVYGVSAGAASDEAELWVVDLADGRQRRLEFPDHHALSPVLVWRVGLLVEGLEPPFPTRRNRLYRIAIDAIPVAP